MATHLGRSGPDPAFWRNKRVLITGHTGFKGSWLCLWLQRLGAVVTGYAIDPPTNPNLFQLASVGDGLLNHWGDVRDLGHLTEVMTSVEPEIVIHLAAQPLVRRAYAMPVETYATNVMGTVHLLDAVRQCGSVRVAVVVTSDRCYRQQRSRRGHREDDPLGGNDPYSASKGCAELVTASFQRSFFDRFAALGRTVSVASSRAGNLIGGGDWAADRLIPDIIRAFAARRAALIRNPAAVRPWQHVLEPLGGYLLLAQRLWDAPQLAGGWNFGPKESEARPVSWVVERVARLWGEGAHWRQDDAPHPPESDVLRLDCSRARERLGWAPRLPLATALEWTVEWYRAQGEGDDMRRWTLEQIGRYERLLDPRDPDRSAPPALPRSVPL